MTGRGTKHSITGLWTGITTLLLLIAQGSSALSEAAPSLHSESITESPSGSVAPLHKFDTTVDVPSTTLKYADDVSEAGIEGTIVDKLSNSSTSKPNGSQDSRSISGDKSENQEIQEPLKRVTRIEDTRPTNGSEPEFVGSDDTGEIEDLEGDNGREPTTEPPKNRVDKETTVPKDPKHKAKDPVDEKLEKSVQELGISLVNDTNVNYSSKKPVKNPKDEGTFDNDPNGSRTTLENATNVIASGSDVTDGQEKGKGPKAQVEVVKNSTLPKVLRITESEVHEKRKEVESLGTAVHQSAIETSESTATPEPKPSADEKTSDSTTSSGDDEETGKDTKIPQVPRARTISFGGTNEFLTSDNKTAGATRATSPTDQPINHIVPEVTTKEPTKEYKGANDFKPYPYAKANYPSNSSDISLNADTSVPESTEGASALENTIGQRRDNKKFVVTEPSVVIDNSIQQFKPTYYKRSGNSSRVSTNSFSTVPTTATSLEGQRSVETTPSFGPLALENDTTDLVLGLPVSNTENDVPRSKDEVAKSSLGPKDTSGTLDLTGNGITEIIAKNDTVPVLEGSVTTEVVPLATSSLSLSRATDDTLVQNSTDKISTIDEELALTNVDVQTDPEESMLNVSKFNVTEAIEIDYSQSTTDDVAPNQNFTSTFRPETSTKSNFTTVTSLTSTLVPPEGLSVTTLVPDATFASTSPPEISSVTTTFVMENSTRSNANSTISAITNVTPLTSSLSDLSTTTPSALPNATSAYLPITESEVESTLAPETSTEGLASKSSKATDSLSSEEPTESTTLKIEYAFVGLTESTTPQQYVASSESSNSVKLDEEFSSSSSSLLGSSTLSSLTTASGVSGNVSEATETPEQISTDPVTLVAANDTREEPATTISNFEFNSPEDSTISTEEHTLESTTMIEQEVTTLTNEFEETTMEETTTGTNATNPPEIISDPGKNTTDTGRAADSATNAPEKTGTKDESLNSTIFEATEAIDSTTTTEISTLSEETTATSTNLTSQGRIENSTSKTTLRIFPKNISTSSPMPDTTTMTEGTADVATDDSIEISSRGGVPSLVKVVFEGSWADVCPHLDVLRQSLADLLTSGLEKTVLASQIVYQKNPCSSGFSTSTVTTESSVTTLLLYVVDESGNFDGEMTKTLPTLYSKSPVKLQVNIRSFQLVQDADSGNAIAVVVVSCVALICLVLLAGLLFIMRKRQARFNYGERCRPVSLDAYSLDSVSAYNSVRRKGAARASKRSYGNPTFEDSSAIPSHPLNFAGLSTFCNEQNAISEEFTGIPQVTARIDELPQGAEVKNRYANVVPLPETRVSLMKINNDPLTEYINASYVRGPKNATKYYIACQAPIESTVTDFWRMIWEQQSKVVIMLTDLVENGVEKCAEYVPPSEVTDCHRLFGDFQVTLKKRETKEKYAISTLHLKNLENNTFREISHIWYLWPANGVQSDAAGLIAVLLEARALQRGGPGPIVVHCSPGTGRTGTLIALDLGIRQYEITRTVDVPRVVYTIRRDRAGAVQTKEQYAFIYKALNLYATKLAGGALES